MVACTYQEPFYYNSWIQAVYYHTFHCFAQQHCVQGCSMLKVASVVGDFHLLPLVSSCVMSCLIHVSCHFCLSHASYHSDQTALACNSHQGVCNTRSSCHGVKVFKDLLTSRHGKCTSNEQLSGQRKRVIRFQASPGSDGTGPQG